MLPFWGYHKIGQWVFSKYSTIMSKDEFDNRYTKLLPSIDKSLPKDFIDVLNNAYLPSNLEEQLSKYNVRDTFTRFGTLDTAEASYEFGLGAWDKNWSSRADGSGRKDAYKTAQALKLTKYFQRYANVNHYVFSEQIDTVNLNEDSGVEIEKKFDKFRGTFAPNSACK